MLKSISLWKGRIVVECTRLESVQGVKAFRSSNLLPSARAPLLVAIGDDL